MGGNAKVRKVAFDYRPGPEKAVELFHRLIESAPVCGPRKADKPLALYGAGKLGKMAKEYFDAIGLPVSLVIDANPDKAKEDPFWRGVAVKGPDEASKAEKSGMLLAVCVAMLPFTELGPSLAAKGWEDVVPFYDVAEAYRSVHPLGNGWFAGKFTDEGIKGTERALKGWSDDHSRAHHLQFIAWHYAREEWFFDGAPVTTGDRYFIPQVLAALKKGGVLFDIGAHHGQTVQKFIELTGGDFEAIYAFEPDEANNAALVETVSGLGPALSSRVHPRKTALSDATGTSRFFDGAGFASQLHQSGNATARTATLDSLDLAPTLIKIHVEGVELEVLKGGVATIRRARPVIAVTSYHNELGIWQIPVFLMDTLERYRFYARQHSWLDTGSTVYCIPEE